MKSGRAISFSLAAGSRAAPARATVAALRSCREVSTLSPCSTRRLPTGAPMAPGAITATTGLIALVSDWTCLQGLNPAAIHCHRQGVQVGVDCSAVGGILARAGD